MTEVGLQGDLAEGLRGEYLGVGANGVHLFSGDVKSREWTSQNGPALLPLL